MASSPSTLLYFRGSGNLYYTPIAPTPGVERHMGNAPLFETEPVIETEEHIESMSGQFAVDEEDITKVSGTVRIELEEFSLENLQLALFGGAITTASASRTMELIGATSHTGSLRLSGTNAKGNQYDVFVAKVSFKPAGGVSWVSRERGKITLEGAMLKVNGSFGTVDEKTVAA